MRARLKSTLPVCLCVIGFFAAIGALIGNDAAELPQKADPLVKVSLTQPDASCPILFIQVKNLREDTLYATSLGRIPLGEIQVHDAAGKPCLWTQMGKSYWDPQNTMRTVSTENREVEPLGQTKWDFDLTEYFRLSPGKYTVSFQTILHMPLKRGVWVNEQKKCDVHLEHFVVP